ncbi:acylphosphatase [Patescibacteria group bacterium]|nr:acylphosphatase [Patescibacteria group bacterium]
MKKRLVLKIYGQVQGVNFRSMVKMKCLDLKLTGQVKNTSEGSVFIEVEGDQDKLEDMVEWINKNPGFSKVTSIEDHWSDATGKFDDFSIT